MATVPELLALYPWARSLPVDGLASFAREYTDALGDVAHLDELLAAWKATAAIYAEPELVAALTRPLPAPTGGRVPRP